MAPTGRPPLRAQIVILVVAALVAGVGAAIWSRTVASGDDDGVERVTLDRSVAVELPPGQQNPELGGDPFSALDVLTPDGQAFRLESDGRPMVVNFWYSACGPCSRELKWFGGLSAELGERVRFVGVNPMDEPERMVDYAADRGVTYELYLDDDFAAQDRLGILGYPLTLFVAADGTVVGQANELSDHELREQVAVLLT